MEENENKINTHNNDSINNENSIINTIIKTNDDINMEDNIKSNSNNFDKYNIDNSFDKNKDIIE